MTCAMLRVLLVGSGSSGSSYLRIAHDLLYYGLVAAWHRLRVALLQPPPPCPPLPAAETVDGESLLSVVIPTFNEADSIGEVVRTALLDAHVEVIVSDGGSRDGTQDQARAAGARVLDAPPGRASCCNAGAAAARGPLLLFIHGDTLLPPGFGQMLRSQLRAPGVAVAAFRLSLHPRLPFIWLVEIAANRRSARRSLPYGDQGLALRREAFEALGRFPEQQFLEDLHLVLEARRRGAVVTMAASVRSSARRWQMNGVLGNSVRNQCVLLGYLFGVPIPRIAEWYYGAQGKKSY